ncbi:MAG: exodeoxyribonuclease VII large subunit [Elusimicrobiota bacterium]
MRDAAQETYTVSQVNKGVAAALAQSFPDAFWVSGEIQGYDRDAGKAAGRRWGQVYFELVEKKDGADSVKAGIKALMWGDAREAVLRKLAAVSDKLFLQDGLKVRFLCRVDFYWPRAGLQLKVEDVDPTFTLGDMERARRALLLSLREKGLLDKNKSLSFPAVPLRVGLITSEGSAAYHDFLEELKSSGYAFRVSFWDARTQGAETEENVCRGLLRLGRSPDVDVVVVARGGGSRSDLVWFDKEKIALAIARCPKPVLTGIGHDIDLSVADMVAHKNFKTPTAAAQFLAARARAFEEGLKACGAGVAEAARTRLAENRHALRENLRAWQYASQTLAARFRGELAQCGRDFFHGARRQLHLRRERLSRSPERLAGASAGLLRACAERLDSVRRECALKDPRRLLERGYCLLVSDGKIVKSVDQTDPGRDLEARLRDGVLSARVLSKRKAVP